MVVYCMKIIVVEGIDGSGKSNVSADLKYFLESQGKSVSIYSFPSLNPTGKYIRKLLSLPDVKDIDIAFAYKDDFNFLITTIKDRKSEYLILDRYIWSFIAYQGSALGEKLTNELLKEIELVDVDLYFLLDVDVDVAFSRIHTRGAKKDFMEAKGKAFFKKVKHVYQGLSKDEKCVVIDSNKSENQVVKDCISNIEELNLL